MAKYPPPSVVFDFNPYSLPAEFLSAIGLVTAASAQTEHIIEQFIAGCLGIDDEYGMAITTHMTAPLRDSVARAVAEIRIDSIGALDELDKILDNIKASQDKRNNTVHHSWAIHPDSKEIHRVKTTARGSLRVSLIKVTIDEIKFDAEFIYIAGMALQTFMTENGLLPSSMPIRPRGHKTRSERQKRRPPE